MTTYFIYMLLNGENVFYVGSTIRPSVRLQTHYQKLGFKPEMVIIDELESKYRSHVRQLEEYWIHQFRSWGFSLNNKRLVKHRMDAQRSIRA